MFEGIDQRIAEHPGLAATVACALMLSIHFFGGKPRIPWFLLALIFAIAIFGVMLLPFETDLRLEAVAGLTIIYGSILYIVICEAMLAGLAQWLTRKRGEQWVKELDYLYLTLGAFGVLATINRIDHLQGRLSKFDLFVPIALATAVVIRFIKTRAEIAGWNKPPAS
jgi:hypothetical protein